MSDSIENLIKTMRLPYLRVSLTPDCNAGCSFCHNEGQKIGKRTNEAGSVSSFLSIDQYKDIAIRYRKFFNKVTFTGGEPTLVKELPEIIRAFKNADYFTTMTTNAILLDDQKQKELVAAGLDRVNISLHSTDRNEFEQIFKVNEVDRVTKNIELLKGNFSHVCKINFMALRNENVPTQLVPITELSAKSGAKVSFMSQVSDRDFEHPLSVVVLDHLQENFSLKKVEKSEEKFNSRRTYFFDNGAIWEFDDFKEESYRKEAFNNSICEVCTKKSRCVEGPYALRVTYDGTAKPCLIRSDNHFSILG